MPCNPGNERQFGVAFQAFRPQVAVQVLKARRRERQKRFDLAAGFLGKLVQVARRLQLLPVARQKMVPHHVEGDRCHAAVGALK